jgi:hypothetical protein
MVEALMAEIARMTNGSITERKKRIAELETQVEQLQRQTLALGAEATVDVPPQVVLGVKLTARRERAA